MKANELKPHEAMTLELFEGVISELEKILSDLGSNFPPPGNVDRDGGIVFRHNEGERSDLLASYLKLIRIQSLLNASICLLKQGYVQEVYILCRCIDEAESEILFLALPSASEKNSHQLRMLKEFYQEEHENHNDPLSSTRRDRVPRKKIHAASSNLRGMENPHHFRRIANAIDSTLSGFVHGAYVFIMELYSGRKGRYRMRGMLNTSRMDECIENFVNYIYRALTAAEVVAQ